MFTNKMKVSNHVLDWHGASGYSLWFIILATFLVALGFSTNGWNVSEGPSSVGDLNEGLWHTCRCKRNEEVDDWMKEVQITVSCGLGCLVLSLICGLHYMLVHFLSKRVLLAMFLFFTISGVALLTAGLTVFGKNSTNLNYSYGLVASGVIVSGISFLCILYQIRISEKCCLY